MKRIDDSRIPKTFICSETRDGSGKQGHPLLRYSDNCKRDMKFLNMNVESWKECAIQHSLWKEKVTKGAQGYEQALVQRKELNRQKRKHPRLALDPSDDVFICEQCNKHCRCSI